jgi:serine/threonine-protein kinase
MSSRVCHPNVVSTLDFHEESGVPFIVQELAAGRALDAFVEAHGPFDEPAALDLVLQVLSGMTAIHEQGILHRDLKPANIIVLEHPGGHLVPRIIDFGVAFDHDDGDPRLTRQGALVGSPAWMAPEQARGGPLDARADIYGVGLILHRLLGGGTLEARNLYEVLRLKLEAKALALGPMRASSKTRRLVQRMTAFDPSRRPQTADRAVCDVWAAQARGSRRRFASGSRPRERWSAVALGAMGAALLGLATASRGHVDSRGASPDLGSTQEDVEREDDELRPSASPAIPASTPTAPRPRPNAHPSLERGA